MRTLARRVFGYVAAVLIMWVFWEVSSLLLRSPALPLPAEAFRQFV